MSTAVLINLSDPLLPSLKLTHNDKAVSKLSVATIEIRNSGSQPIERADFDAPLMLRFKHPLDVLAVTLSDKNPTSLQPLIASEDGTISIFPLLLNSGDHFRITVQIRDDFVEPAVETRISGVPAISRKMFATPDPTTKGMVRLEHFAFNHA